MSKKNKESGVPMCSWGTGYVVYSDTPDRLFGRVFTVVEALGLPEKQEDSLRNLIRGAIWNVFEDAIFITSERHDKIRQEFYEKKKEATEMGNPMSAI